jgi:SUN domain-containing protein 1/2
MGSVAAAFHAAQTGHLPTPTTSTYRKPPRSDTGRRALSPAEQLADSARALSPVRYFLHPGDNSNNDSGEYPSFASLGQQSSTNTSYDYQKEEEFVRNRMRNENLNGHGHSRKMSESSRRRKKAEDGDMPYRPAEDDYAAESDASEAEEEEGGGGIVNGGALEGRASTRGKTKEKGEGYLGMGLGIQPKKKSSRKNGDVLESDDEEDRQSPAPSYGARGYSRSPTPAQLLRAITPRLSPGPRPLTPRRRQPSSLRTIITNILHGLVLALRFVTDTMTNIIEAAIIKPLRSITGSGKLAMRRLKKDGWKILGGLLALSLLLRLLGRPWSARTGPVGHGALGLGSETADELATRLSSLEHALASLSHSTGRQPVQGNTGGNDDSYLIDRLSRLEASLADEHQRLDDLRGESASVSRLRQDLDKVVSRVDSHDSDIASASSRHQSVERLEQELKGLRTRVDGVETEVRNALDDGRLNKAIERILPDWMPVKRKGHRIDIEPVFWNELKRVLVGKSDMDKAVQDALAGVSTGGVSRDDLERFGDKLFEQKSAQGLIVSKEQFLMAMNNELEDLKSRLDRAELAQPKSSSITIKGSKGDDIVPLLSSLIDTAILKYSKDTLATPDYALYTAGARVVPSITSDTLVMKSANRLGKWLAGSRDIEGRAPATALHPDNSVGSCWPFNGSRGQLGVLLSRRVVVTDVTVEHAAKELSPDVKTAPKAIEVVCPIVSYS